MAGVHQPKSLNPNFFLSVSVSASDLLVGDSLLRVPVTALSLLWLLGHPRPAGWPTFTGVRCSPGTTSNEGGNDVFFHPVVPLRKASQTGGVTKWLTQCRGKIRWRGELQSGCHRAFARFERSRRGTESYEISRECTSEEGPIRGACEKRSSLCRGSLSGTVGLIASPRMQRPHIRPRPPGLRS